MRLHVLKTIAAGAVLAVGAAHAATTELDLSTITNGTNDSFQIGQPVGQSVGNTGTALASLRFDLLDPATTSNVWVGSSTGMTADLQTDIYGATSVATLMNTFYGQLGSAAVTVEFKGSAGADETFTLIGGTDIRDYNNWVWTNSINGTTTQEWWTNNFSPTSQDQTHRLDAQLFTLAASFATQTLTDIVFTAGTSGVNYSEPMLSAVDVTTAAAVPEPASAALIAAALGCLLIAARRPSSRC
jgi:hypothetical protein